MPSVELLAVGTELLLGQLVDSNTPYVASQLAEAGIDVFATHAVGDNRARIVSAMRGALSRADGVVSTGGLGPTIDDLTKEAAADALGLELDLNATVLRELEAYFSAHGRTMTQNNRKQAYFPRGAHVLENPNGSAPGFVAFGANGKFVASMPGPPREMRPMLVERLVPFLRERLGAQAGITTRVLHTIGLAESVLDERIADLFASMENPKIGVLAHDYQCDVKVMAKAQSHEAAEAMIAPVQAEIERRIGAHLYGRDSDTLAGAVLARLEARGWKIATAESCTGGRIAAALTAVPGASRSFVGGVFAYDNAVKIAELGVDEATLARHGAVSEEVVRAMAEGARERLRSDVAVATTGIAGPDGGTPGKPVGLVWLGLSLPDGSVVAERTSFRGGRDAIQTRATVASLGLLWKYLAAPGTNVPAPA